MAAWERVNQNLLIENHRLRKENLELQSLVRLAWHCVFALVVTSAVMAMVLLHLR